MRKSTGFTAALAASACIALPLHAQTRIDVNGEMVNANTSFGSVNTSFVPYNWSTYSTGASGGIGSKIDNGSSSNAQNINMENEAAMVAANPGSISAGTPGGHSLILGGSGGVGTYGIKQSYSVSPPAAGSVYWLSGGISGPNWGSGALTQLGLDFGVEAGSGVGAGKISTGQITFQKFGDTGAPGLGGRFSQAVYVPSGTTQVTAHVGIKANGTQNINAYIDGVRVYELPVNIYSSLYNGNFEAAGTQDISNYNANGASPIYLQQDLVPGWVPLGGSAGQQQRYDLNTAADVHVHGGTNSFSLETWKGSGRMFAAQRVDSGGPGTYTFSGYAFNTDSTLTNAMLGIDPTGGMDPYSANIIWSAAATGNAAFNALTVSGTDLTGNGVTVFIASGNDYAAFSGGRSSAHMGGYFDDLTLTFVPEPATLVLLALSSVMLTGRRRRA